MESAFPGITHGNSIFDIYSRPSRVLGDRVSLGLDTLNLKEVVEYFPDPDSSYSGGFFDSARMPSP